MNTQMDTNEYIVMNAVFAKIDKTAFAIASALIFFLGMFSVTAFLILKGATPTFPIGPNLQSLDFYLPGYSLTWIGSIIGSTYLGLIGAAISFIFSSFWNLIHYLYLAILINRINFFDV